MYITAKKKKKLGYLKTRKATWKVYPNASTWDEDEETNLPLSTQVLEICDFFN